MENWREKMIVTFIEIAKAEGISTFEEVRVKDLFVKLANLERNKTPAIRIGYAYSVDNFSAKGLAKLFKQLEDRWDGSKPVAPKIPQPVNKTKLPELDTTFIPESLEAPIPPSKTEIEQFNLPNVPPPKPIVEEVIPSSGEDIPEDIPEEESIPKYKLQCVFCIQLIEGTQLKPLEIALKGKEITELGITVGKIVNIHNDWWDVQINYSVNLANVYKELLKNVIINDIVTKPISDFGKRTIATMK